MLSLHLQNRMLETMSHGMEFTNATIHAEANVYFDGRVISHTIILGSGERKTAGVILSGSYHFGTKQAERMEIIKGECEVVLDGGSESHSYGTGEAFDVASDSGFTISVSGEPCHYICSFLSA